MVKDKNNVRNRLFNNRHKKGFKFSIILGIEFIIFRIEVEVNGIFFEFKKSFDFKKTKWLLLKVYFSLEFFKCFFSRVGFSFKNSRLNIDIEKFLSPKRKCSRFNIFSTNFFFLFFTT
jgi:hypothetical protein